MSPPLHCMMSLYNTESTLHDAPPIYKKYFVCGSTFQKPPLTGFILPTVHKLHLVRIVPSEEKATKIIILAEFPELISVALVL